MIGASAWSDQRTAQTKPVVATPFNLPTGHSHSPCARALNQTACESRFCCGCRCRCRRFPDAEEFHSKNQRHDTDPPRTLSLNHLFVLPSYDNLRLIRTNSPTAKRLGKSFPGRRRRQRMFRRLICGDTALEIINLIPLMTIDSMRSRSRIQLHVNISNANGSIVTTPKLFWKFINNKKKTQGETSIECWTPIR